MKHWILKTKILDANPVYEVIGEAGENRIRGKYRLLSINGKPIDDSWMGPGSFPFCWILEMIEI